MSEASAVKHVWEEMPRERLNERLERRIVSGQRAMLTHVYLKRGCIVPRHVHDNEQITYVLEGTLRLWTGESEAAEQEWTLRAGEVLVIPPNLPHRAEALEDTLDVDIFSPPRQDWLDGTDDYLRRG
jgi:quercetin dioxygenase-like cupin family protein